MMPGTFIAHCSTATIPKPSRCKWVKSPGTNTNSSLISRTTSSHEAPARRVLGEALYIPITTAGATPRSALPREHQPGPSGWTCTAHVSGLERRCANWSRYPDCAIPVVAVTAFAMVLRRTPSLDRRSRLRFETDRHVSFASTSFAS